jgi:hypothetical protein
VNGRRCPVTRVAPSAAGDETDPFAVHKSAPAPLGPAAPYQGIVERIAQAAPAAWPPAPAEGRVPIFIPGVSVPRAPCRDGWPPPTVTPRVGHAFRITCDEWLDGTRHLRPGLHRRRRQFDMTQFTRYIEHRSSKVRAIRFVQTLPFNLYGTWSTACRRRSGAGRHPRILHAEEPDEVMQNLLRWWRTPATCTRRCAAAGRVALSLNGE